MSAESLADIEYILRGGSVKNTRGWNDMYTPEMSREEHILKGLGMPTPKFDEAMRKYNDKLALQEITGRLNPYEGMSARERAIAYGAVVNTPDPTPDPTPSETPTRVVTIRKVHRPVKDVAPQPKPIKFKMVKLDKGTNAPSAPVAEEVVAPVQEPEVKEVPKEKGRLFWSTICFSAVVIAHHMHLFHF